MKTVVIYHASCTDGFCAAWLFHNVFPGAAFIPAQYGQTVPIDKIDSDDQVFIVDFSYRREQMLELWRHLTGRMLFDDAGRPRSSVGSLLVLDHHKTAEDACRGLDFCRFDIDKSGARLAWEYLCSDECRVAGMGWANRDYLTLVDYTEDRDLWKWKLPNSKEINSAIRSYPMTFEAWDAMPKAPEVLASQGSAIERYRQMAIEQHVKNAVEIEIGGYRVLGVCCTFGEIGSEVAEALIPPNDDLFHGPFGCYWFDLSKTGERVYSLRSRGDFDVSDVAKQYGGGGHKNAAGFKTQIGVKQTH